MLVTNYTKVKNNEIWNMYRIKKNRIITEEQYQHEDAIETEKMRVSLKRWAKALVLGGIAGTYFGLGWAATFNYRHAENLFDIEGPGVGLVLGTIFYRLTPKWGNRALVLAIVLVVAAQAKRFVV